MPHQPTSRTGSDRPDVDLAATRRRFLVAREQSAAQSSTRHIRSMAMGRWTERPHTEPADS